MDIISQLVEIDDKIMLSFLQDKYLADVLFRFVKAVRQDRLAIGYKLLGVLTYVGDNQEVSAGYPGYFGGHRLRIVGYPIERSN